MTSFLPWTILCPFLTGNGDRVLFQGQSLPSAATLTCQNLLKRQKRSQNECTECYYLYFYLGHDCSIVKRTLEFKTLFNLKIQVCPQKILHGPLSETSHFHRRPHFPNLIRFHPPFPESYFKGNVQVWNN